MKGLRIFKVMDWSQYEQWALLPTLVVYEGHVWLYWLKARVGFGWYVSRPSKYPLASIDIITREALMVLSNQLEFASAVNREFEAPHEPGKTINVRRPQRFIDPR